MLARHADNLFWMARYLERSENLSRRIQATLHHALSQEDEGEEERTCRQHKALRPPQELSLAVAVRVGHLILLRPIFGCNPDHF